MIQNHVLFCCTLLSLVDYRPSLFVSLALLAYFYFIFSAHLFYLFFLYLISPLSAFKEWMEDNGGSIVNIIANAWNGMPGMA